MNTQEWRSALAGLTAAAAALAVGELVAGFSQQLTSPVISVGNRVIDASPPEVKEFAISTFGHNDKKALAIGIFVLATLFGLGLGVAAGRRFVVGAAGIGLFGAVGLLAAVNEVDAPWWAGLPSVIGAAVGIAVLAFLLVPVGDVTEAPDATHRRAFLIGTSAVLAGAAITAAAGRRLQSGFSAMGSRLAVVLPKAAKPVAAYEGLATQGITPFITPNRDFYRIDTNFTVPQLPAEDWSLRIHGMVERELTFTYDDILALPQEEHRITIACVSNRVGGDLVGNAVWLGTPLLPLLEQAGIDPAADQVVGRAFDGFTTGFPVDAVKDGRNALLAVGMNGEPLPLDHGFPARLVVPGLYGYVSATKWLTEIELTTFADFDQYWVRQTWAVDGTVHTQSRIDTPARRRTIPAGPTAIGGVAWAQHRGIERVEVRVDGGAWQEAELAPEDTIDTWRQWVLRWEATPGEHVAEVRATDQTGKVQTQDERPPYPAGATGWHSRKIKVAEG
ncbi:MAG: molybdopterin-dependent oxidoreductase [Aquihabitans sp.]